MTQPSDEGTDQESISAYVTLLKEAKAVEIVEGPSDGTGLDAPVSRLDLTLDDGKTITVAIGGPAPGEKRVYGLQDTGAIGRAGRE